MVRRLFDAQVPGQREAAFLQQRSDDLCGALPIRCSHRRGSSAAAFCVEECFPWRQSPPNCTGRYLRNCTGPVQAAGIILSSMISNSRVRLAVGPYEFKGTLELKTAPISAAWLIKQFPLKGTLQHACWSGEAVWLPLSGAPQLVPENATTRPRP